MTGVSVLLLAALLRLASADYGLAEVCLALPEENWLYRTTPQVSLYHWSALLPFQYPTPDADTRQFAAAPQELFILRGFSAALGVLACALVMSAARRLRVSWWVLAGIVMACAPPFVQVGQLVHEFAPALLASALSLWAMIFARTVRAVSRQTMYSRLSSAAALSLILLAAPAAWLIPILILLQPRRQWKWYLFVLFVLVMCAPVLRFPALWLDAWSDWDVGAAAAVAVLILGLFLWKARAISALREFVLVAAVLLVSGSFLLADSVRRVEPTAEEWEFVRYMQDRVFDGAAVNFDGTTFHLAPIIACPNHLAIDLRAQPPDPLLPFAWDPYPDQVPTFRINAPDDEITDDMRTRTIAGRYAVTMDLPVPMRLDIRLGDLFYVLDAAPLVQSVPPGGLLLVRVDYQFSGSYTVDALRKGLFIHVTDLDDPGEKWVDYSVDFQGLAIEVGPRRLVLNQQYPLVLPSDMPPGDYAIWMGMFNYETGERLMAETGETALRIGTLRVE